VLEMERAAATLSTHKAAGNCRHFATEEEGGGGEWKTIEQQL
jgi:hypothetical protein